MSSSSVCWARLMISCRLASSMSLNFFSWALLICCSLSRMGASVFRNATEMAQHHKDDALGRQPRSRASSPSAGGFSRADPGLLAGWRWSGVVSAPPPPLFVGANRVDDRVGELLAKISGVEAGLVTHARDERGFEQDGRHARTGQHIETGALDASIRYVGVARRK